jgi:predicted RNA-binding protein with PIN domain
MLEYWLIDGYNLLHDLHPSKQGKKPSKEMLFDLLADFASADENRRVLLVLDGKGSDAEHDAVKTSSFSASYSQEVSADTFIEKYLYDHRATARLFVVTNDRAITLLARGGGASVFSTALFMDRVGDAKKNTEEHLRRADVRTHGFNRPLDDKLREKGL